MPRPDLKHLAQQLFSAQGLPTRKLEHWKYTPFQRLLKTVLDQEAPDSRLLPRPQLQIPPQKNRLIFADGHFMPELSDWPIEIEVQAVKPLDFSVDQLTDHPLLC